MAFPRWKFVVSTYSGQKRGEVLNAVERTCSPTIQAPGTAGFRILATNSLLDDLFNLPLNLLCYRNGLLMFHGPIISTQFTAENESATPQVGVTAADPSWRFDKRVMDRNTVGTTRTNNRLTLAETSINDANVDGETGVQTLGQTIGGSSAFVVGPYRKLSEIIADLANTAGGFDWRIVPIEYTGGKIGQFLADTSPSLTSATRMGSTQSGVVFEYQGRGNTRNPNFLRAIDGMANDVFSIPDDGPASALTVLEKNDSTAISTYGLYQDIADTSNIGETALRNDVLNSHIAFRKNPREIYTFEPDISDGSGRVPEYGHDYTIGDYVRARVIYNQAVIVDGYVRLYKMDFTIDEQDRETAVPTVVAEATS